VQFPGATPVVGRVTVIAGSRTVDLYARSARRRSSAAMRGLLHVRLTAVVSDHAASSASALSKDEDTRNKRNAPTIQNAQLAVVAVITVSLPTIF
jgi:hypothetical protein